MPLVICLRVTSSCCEIKFTCVQLTNVNVASDDVIGLQIIDFSLVSIQVGSKDILSTNEVSRKGVNI